MDSLRICLKCNKKMRVIKNDFKLRKYCKKCHFENEEDIKIKSLMELLLGKSKENLIVKKII